eukprot:scaffold195571_cov31-Tisochrysis_lutea.AAC.1
MDPSWICPCLRHSHERRISVGRCRVRDSRDERLAGDSAVSSPNLIKARHLDRRCSTRAVARAGGGRAAAALEGEVVVRESHLCRGGSSGQAEGGEGVVLGGE